MRSRALLGVAGELMLTAGLVVLLLCGYLGVWTDVTAGRAQAAVERDLRARWAAPPPSPAAAGPAPRRGEAFALLDVPALGVDDVPLLEGTGRDELRRGVGHYRRTPLPGAAGNVGVAGHRTTYGAPFARLDRLRPGDEVVLRTRAAAHRYAVERSWVVGPEDGDVLDPVPGRRLLTLTTCHPRWSARERLVVRARLVASEPVAP